MHHLSRRRFLQTAATLSAIPFINKAFGKYDTLPLLSFSTLGCPDWDFTKITDFAVQHGFRGIELRGLQRQMDLTLSPEFNTAESRKKTMGLLKKKGLKLVNLGASANLHTSDAAERKKQLDEARKFIDLAHELSCPYIRVFPNNLPPEREKEDTIHLIAEGLSELGNYAKDKSVMVLMETHGDLVHASDILEVMQLAANPHTGLVWDISNMWTITKEPPSEVYELLKPYIRHTHLKDAKLVNGKLDYAFLGKGEVPVFEAIDLLAKDGYKGYYSFEWEKLWHPEIADPELAFADYAQVMKDHFKQG